MRGLNNRGGVAAVARAQPTQRCAPLNGVPPAGLGKALATVAGAVMCEACDLVKKWPYWQHTLVESVEKKIDMRHLSKGRQKDAGTEGPIRVLEEVDSQAC